jgi:hypothetical protein
MAVLVFALLNLRFCHNISYQFMFYSRIRELSEDDSLLGYSAVISALMVEVVRTSETSVYFNETTRRYIAEGCHLRTHRHENLKSQGDT